MLDSFELAFSTSKVSGKNSIVWPESVDEAL
jgi:hypothetical protein